MSFVDYPGPVLGVPELESLEGHAFQLLLQLDKVGCSRMMGGGQLDFTGAAASSAVGSVGALVSMCATRSGAK
jgi:hypothetical protein